MAVAGGYANKDRPYHSGDAELLAMIDQDVTMRYMGSKGHIMAYPLKGNVVYNTVLIHPSKATNDTEEDV